MLWHVEGHDIAVLLICPIVSYTTILLDMLVEVHKQCYIYLPFGPRITHGEDRCSDDQSSDPAAGFSNTFWPTFTETADNYLHWKTNYSNK